MVFIQDILTNVKIETPSYEMEKECIEFIPSNQCIQKMHMRLELERNISSLGLSLVVPLSHLDDESLYYNEDKYNNQKTNKKDLTGGKEKEWYEPFQDQLFTYAASSPITTIHVATGTTLYLLKTFGIVDNNKLLYHSSKAFFPRFQVHRVVTNNFVFGQSLYEVGRRIYNLITYGGKLEKYVNGRGDTIRGKKVYIQGVQRIKEDGSLKSTKEWLLTDNKYLKMNLKMAGAIIICDYITSGLGIFTRKSKPYSILGSLEVAITFIYSLIEDESNSQFMGMFTVPPFFMPIFVGFTSGSSVYTILKGLIVGGFMAKSMELERGDGEKVIQYLSRTSHDFWELRHVVIKTLKKIPVFDTILTEIEDTLARYNIYFDEIKHVVLENPNDILNLIDNIKEKIAEFQASQHLKNPSKYPYPSDAKNDVIKTAIDTSNDTKKEN